MTFRCSPAWFLAQRGSMPRGLVSPRFAGPDATAIAVRPVHPTSTPGGRRKWLLRLRNLASVHPSTPLATALTCTHVCTRRRVSARAHAPTASPTHLGQGGQVDGSSIGAGCSRPRAVHPSMEIT
jgi:hypothetical protein